MQIKLLPKLFSNSLLKMKSKIFLVLNKNQKIKIFILFFLNLIGSILEIISIGIIPIFVMVLIKPEQIISLSKDFFFADFVSAIPLDNYLVYGSIIMILVFLLKNTYLSILIYLEYRFDSSVRKFLSQSLYKKYISQEYSFFINTNPSTLIRNISQEIDFAAAYISEIMNLIKEGLVVLFVLILLFGVNFLMTANISFILGIVVFFFYYLQKKRIKEKGVYGQILRSEIVKLINHTFGSIKDIKILGKEKYFSDKFREMYSLNEKFKIYKSIVSSLPPKILESVIIILLVVFIFFYKNSYSSPEEFIAILSLFVVSSLRLYPSFSRINTSLIVVKNLSVSFKLISKQLNLRDNLINLQNFKMRHFFAESVKFKNVHFSFNEKNILRGIDLEIKKGEFIALVGKSGSGKSTIIDLMMGLLTPSQGNITIDGKNIHDETFNTKNLFGYVPQDIYLLDDSIKKNIAFGDTNIDLDKIKKAIDLSQLNYFFEKDNNSIETVVGNRGVKISGGELQRIGIARALYANSDIIVLDEATANLDHETAKSFVKSIIELKNEKTIIFATHQTELIKNCDQVFHIEKGMILKKDKFL